jgi:hypothetical protein
MAPEIVSIPLSNLTEPVTTSPLHLRAQFNQCYPEFANYTRKNHQDFPDGFGSKHRG